MAPDPHPYDGGMFDVSDAEPTKEEMISAPATAVLVELRKLGNRVERQGEAIDRLAVAIEHLAAEVRAGKAKGRDR